MSRNNGQTDWPLIVGLVLFLGTAFATLFSPLSLHLWFEEGDQLGSILFTSFCFLVGAVAAVGIIKDPTI